MGQRKSTKQLSKFLFYVLGHRPDEFGLVPDQDGFIKIKELLKAVGEEEGWGYIRKSDIDEILVSFVNPPVEISGNYIRAKCRDNLPEHTPAKTLPKLLYTCIRRKAYPYVLEKGISPMGYPYVILSSNRDLAERMGKRIDQEPVLLAINTLKATDKRVVFYQAGDSICCAASIPAGCFTGPPLPKQKQEPQKHDLPEERLSQRLPGSFVMKLTDEIDHKKQGVGKKKRKEIAWKKDIKQMRRQKQKKKFDNTF